MARVAEQPRVRERAREREQPRLAPRVRPAVPPPLPWEIAYYVGLVVIAFLLRMHDLGVRAIHHDESLHALYSWRLFQGQGYVHDPMMHGPFQFHANALMFFLFGDSDVTARLAAVLCGTGLVVLAYPLRGELGRWGAMAAATLFAFAPSLLYFSRFTREDIYFGFHTLLMIVGLLGYVRTRQARWLYAGSVGLALGFSTKEAIYLVGFLIVSFAVVWILAEIFHQRVDARADGRVVPDAVQGPGSARPYGSELLGVILAVPPRVALNCVLITLTICVVLFTTFFTNPGGIQSGTIGALQYWIEQQGVARGGQPTYYHFLLIGLYEFFAAILAVAAVLTSGASKRGLAVITGAFVVLGLLFFQVSRPEQQTFFSQHEAAGWFVLGLGYAAALVFFLSRRGSFVFWFTLYWTIGSIAIYTFASEKMPWLLVHMAIPLNLLGAQFLGWALDRADWRRVLTPPFWLATLLGVLVAVLLLAVTTVSLTPATTPLQSTTALQWRLALVLLLAGALFGLYEIGRRHGHGFLTAPVGTGLVLALFALSVHIGWQATYKHGDIPNDMIVYVQTSPDVPRVVQQLEYLGHITGQGKDLPVLLDNGYTETRDGVPEVHESIAWPFEWYLRDWKKKAYFSRTLPPDVGPERPPAILVMATNVDPIRDRVADYVGQKYRLNWWYPEDYKGWTVQSIWEGLRDPATRLKLWRYFLYREPLQPLGSRDFYLYVRPDLARGVVGGGPGAYAPAGTTLAPPAPGAAVGAPAAAPPAGEAPAGAPAVAVGSVNVLGRTATGAPGLQEPKAIARDPAGRLYVVQSQGNRVTVLNPDGTVAATWGRGGTGDGEFQEPWGIAVAPTGEVYVADTWNHRIQKFDAQGRFLTKWGTFADTKGARDLEPGAFWGPRAIAIGPDGNLYVTDTGNKRIQVFDPNGRFLRALGGEGTGPGQFREPVGLAFDPQGNLWVADTWNQRIQRLDLAGRQLAQFAVPGWNSQSVTNKPYLSVDPSGRVYASVPEERRVLVIEPDGRMGTVPELQGYPLQLPIGLLAGPEGALWVADSRAGVVLEVPPRTAGRPAAGESADSPAPPDASPAEGQPATGG
jgi:uncharacterized protein (TIGR03663 family)